MDSSDLKIFIQLCCIKKQGRIETGFPAGTSKHKEDA